MHPRRAVLLFLAGVLSLLGVSVLAAQQFPESLYQEMHWRMIGPFRGGRTVAASGAPGSPFGLRRRISFATTLVAVRSSEKSRLTEVIRKSAGR